MSTLATPFLQSIKNVLMGQPRPDDGTLGRIRVTEDEARSLPQGTRAVRVYSGGAWISHSGKDYVLYEGQTLAMCADCYGTVVTSIGQQPVVLELM